MWQGRVEGPGPTPPERALRGRPLGALPYRLGLLRVPGPGPRPPGPPGRPGGTVDRGGRAVLGVPPRRPLPGRPRLHLPDSRVPQGPRHLHLPGRRHPRPRRSHPPGLQPLLLDHRPGRPGHRIRPRSPGGGGRHQRRVRAVPDRRSPRLRVLLPGRPPDPVVRARRGQTPAPPSWPSASSAPATTGEPDAWRPTGR